MADLLVMWPVIAGLIFQIRHVVRGDWLVVEETPRVQPRQHVDVGRPRLIGVGVVVVVGCQTWTQKRWRKCPSEGSLVVGRVAKRRRRRRWRRNFLEVGMGIMHVQVLDETE